MNLSYDLLHRINPVSHSRVQDTFRPAETKRDPLQGNIPSGGQGYDRILRQVGNSNKVD